MPTHVFEMLDRQRHYKSHIQHLKNIKSRCQSTHNPAADLRFRITRSRQRNHDFHRRWQNEAIDRQNEVLLEKILRLNERRNLKNELYHEFKPHNHKESHRKEQFRIIGENEIIAKRLVESSPKITAKELQRQFRATRGHSQRLKNFMVDQESGEVVSKKQKLMAQLTQYSNRDKQKTMSIGVARGFYTHEDK